MQTCGSFSWRLATSLSDPQAQVHGRALDWFRAVPSAGLFANDMDDGTQSAFGTLARRFQGQ